MPVRHPWGKLSKDAPPSRWLPLETHCLDVAYAFRWLAVSPVVRNRLEVAGGRPLDGVDIDRLCVLAYMHDLGKLNAGFAGRLDPKARRIGHIAPVAALYRRSGAAGRIGAAMAASVGGWAPPAAMASILAAVFSHHGRPLDPTGATRTFALPDQAPHWEPSGGYSPEAALAPFMDAAFAAFPLARDAGAPLPDSPAFVHLLAGLLMLADWIGSSEDLHPLQPVTDPSRSRPAGFHEGMRERLRSVGIDAPAGDGSLSPEEAAGVPGLRPLQAAIPSATGRTVVAEAETASGKTEAALLHWRRLKELGLVDGLYFALPTRVAAVEIHARVKAFVERTMGPEAARAVVLAVPGYAEDRGLPSSVSPDEDGGAVRDDALWASERPKRYLAAQVAVGTIDQCLLGGIRAKHAHMRLSALSRSLLVVDEVHASDVYMGALTRRLLASHRRLGGYSLLLSATLGATARAGLLGLKAGPGLAEAVARPYPSLGWAEGGTETVVDPMAGVRRREGEERRVTLRAVPHLEDDGAVAASAIRHAEAGARVLVVRNTVLGAREVLRAIEASGKSSLLFDLEGVPAAHHGRYASSDRRRLDEAVKAAFGKGNATVGRILVGTQTLEQSLDIDADVLLTDLCPVDVLLQRIGRLHRHGHFARPDGYATPVAEVMVPDEPMAEVLRRPRRGLGRPAGGGAWASTRTSSPWRPRAAPSSTGRRGPSRTTAAGSWRAASTPRRGPRSWRRWPRRTRPGSGPTSTFRARGSPGAASPPTPASTWTARSSPGGIPCPPRRASATATAASRSPRASPGRSGAIRDSWSSRAG